jgi:hypothetical protein
MQPSDDLEPPGAVKPDRKATFLRLLVEATGSDDRIAAEPTLPDELQQALPGLY